jgi:hypothetical protein
VKKGIGDPYACGLKLHMCFTYQHLVTSRVVWNGGMEFPVPMERIHLLHKTQEFLHPLGAKVSLEVEASLCRLEK